MVNPVEKLRTSAPGINRAEEPVLKTRRKAIPKNKSVKQGIGSKKSIDTRTWESKKSSSFTPLKLSQIQEAVHKSPQKKNWTVLCYFAGDNNLEEQMTRDMLELQAKGSGAQMNILAQIDRGANPTLQLGGKPGAVRYYLQQAENKNRISSPELKNLGSSDSSDPKTLKDFLAYGMKEYPAENYLVFVYGHGFGVEGFITDDGEGGKKGAMSLPQFKKALGEAEKEAGVKNSQVLLALESCQMGQVEAAYQFKDVAVQMMASQAPSTWNFPGAVTDDKAIGSDINEMGRHLFKKGQEPQEQYFTFDGLENANRPKNSREISETRTLAWIDLKKLPKMKEAVISFEKAIKKSSLPSETIKAIMEIKSRTGFYQATSSCNYVSDFHDLTGRIIKEAGLKDPNLKKAAQELKSALDQVILGSYHRDNLEHNKNANGLGILASSDPVVFDSSEYQKLDFDRDTGWSEFMISYADGVKPEQLEAQLSPRAVKFPQLKKMSQIAQNGLKDFKAIERECASTAVEIKAINNNPKLTHMEKRFLVLNKIKDISVIRKMDKLNRTIDAPRNQILEGALETISEYGYTYPEQLPHLIKSGLLLFSALEGEISNKTLVKGAQKLMEDTRVETGKQAGENYSKRMLGNQLLKVLGFAARNEEIFYQANNARDNFTGLLKETGRQIPAAVKPKTDFVVTKKIEKALEKLPIYFNTWDLPRLNPLEMTRVGEVREAYGYTGKGVGVAVVGSGFNYPDIPLAGWYDAVEGQVHPVDFKGDGTHSAGNVLNMAPEAGLTAVKVTDSQGKIDPQKAARGIDWVVDNLDKLGIKIMQINFGGLEDNTPVKEALERAVKAGMLVLVPAGDKGPGENTINPLAKVPGVVTVGSAWSEETVSEFSGAGKGKVRPDFMAPGQSIVSLSSKNSELEKQAGAISFLRKRNLTPAVQYLNAHPEIKAALKLPDDLNAVPENDLEQMILDSVADFKNSDLKEQAKKIPDMIRPNTPQALKYLNANPALKASLNLPDDLNSLEEEKLTEIIQMNLPALEIPEPGTVMTNGSAVSVSLAAGASALLLEADPTLSAREIKSILQETALDMGDEYPLTLQGAGFLDAKAAVDLALEKKAARKGRQA